MTKTIPRNKVEEFYKSIPLWKKILTCCVLKRKQWKLARAHNKVAYSMLLTDKHYVGEAVQKAGDEIWCEIYGFTIEDNDQSRKDREQ